MQSVTVKDYIVQAHEYLPSSDYCQYMVSLVTNHDRPLLATSSITIAI